MDLGSFKWPTQRVKEMHLKENTFFDLDIGIKVTLNVAQYLLHHATHAALKFEADTCNGLGGDVFT